MTGSYYFCPTMPAQNMSHRQLRSAQELQSIVKTMKALAAGNIHQYENAVQSLATFNRTLNQGLQIFLAALSRSATADSTATPTANQGGLGIVVFGSDQGMCGRFNEQMAIYVLRHLRRSPLVGRQKATDRGGHSPSRSLGAGRLCS